MTADARVLIVEARFYPEIADQLAQGVIAVLDEAGVAFDCLEVPGTFEIPAAIRFADDAAVSNHAYDGFIALGCVIRGETDHYDHICRETSRALMDLSIDRGLAIGFGVLTCETMDQASARADVAKKNKGAEVAEACLRMIELKSGNLRLSSQ